ncbi:MAG: TIGR03067 domain-containing protein [Verrucomicrobia bacterium]|nr:TIGR03067 domain-containing protein [Verrucomicrobiota bacterium]
MSHPLHGIWQMVRAESGGEPSSDLLGLRVELHLSADTYHVHFAGELADQGTYQRGSTEPHSTLILVGAKGPNAGRTIPCIYQLVGDRLRVCYGLDGTTPTAFATTAGSTHYLATYRRKAV